MNEYQELITLIAMTMGISWASGINLYAAVLVLGFGGATGNVTLPEGLQVLQDPLVIGAAGLMYGVEFFADKTPGVDTGWDAIHTFIRIPAGAMLAASAVGDVSPAMQISAGLLGGSVTGITHAGKAGSRVLINSSPEPVSNWIASFSEDFLVIAGLLTALHHPMIFLVLFVIFIALLIWLLPKLWRGIKFLFSKLKRLFGGGDDGYDQALDDLETLKRSFNRGDIDKDEFETRKNRLLFDNS